MIQFIRATRQLGTFFTIFILLSCQSIDANTTLNDAFVDTVGMWRGELFYLDYQSDKRYSIPMRVENSVTPDSATLVRHLTFIDPGRKVYAVQLVSIDKDKKQLQEAYFREGKGEFYRFQITESKIQDKKNWTMSYIEEGVDDNRPARIRHTLKRKGEILESSKSVLYLDKADQKYILRNGSFLTRVHASP